MGFIDKNGRPEIIAQPFIKKGLASPRVVKTGDPDRDQDPVEPRRGGRGRAHLEAEHGTTDDTNDQS